MALEQDVLELDGIKKRDMVSSLERGLTVLTAFDQGTIQMTPADVARRTDLPRAVTRRILLTLCRLGYAMTDGKHFRLTPKVLNLSHHYVGNSPVREWIEPILKVVVDQLRESCTFNVRDRDDTVSVISSNASSFGAVLMNVGLRIPLHVSTPGRVILALSPPRAVEEYLDRTPLTPFTPKTITDRDALLCELDDIRKTGHAVGREEWEVGVFAISVPVFIDGSRTVSACLTLVGNAARLTDQDAVDARLKVLRAAADQIGSVLPSEGAFRQFEL